MKHTIPRTPFTVRLRSILQRKKKRPPAMALVLTALTALLCGSLVSCQPQQEAPPADSELSTDHPSTLTGSPAAQDESGNAPVETSPSPDSQAVLEYVDALLDSETVTMQCFVFPGTGPFSISMDDYREQVREVFARYTWTCEEEAEPKRESALDTWPLYLNSTGSSDGPYTIIARSNSTWIVIHAPTPEGISTVCYSYDGEPGSLVCDLAKLWVGPDIWYTRVFLAESIQDDNALAEAYADAFRDLYLASGAITDYELRDLEVLPRENEDDVSRSFRMTYAVKPADPADPGWQFCPQAEDDWITFSIDMHLDTTEGVWFCAWWEDREAIL